MLPLVFQNGLEHFGIGYPYARKHYVHLTDQVNIRMQVLPLVKVLFLTIPDCNVVAFHLKHDPQLIPLRGRRGVYVYPCIFYLTSNSNKISGPERPLFSYVYNLTLSNKSPPISLHKDDIVYTTHCETSLLSDI